LASVWGGRNWAEEKFTEGRRTEDLGFVSLGMEGNSRRKSRVSVAHTYYHEGKTVQKGTNEGEDALDDIRR